MLPALRGLFFLVDMLQTLSGLFSVVDMLPGSPLSGHLPFVLSWSLDLHGVYEFMPLCPSIIVGQFSLPFHFQFSCSLMSIVQSFSQPPLLTSLLVLSSVTLVKIHSCGIAGINRSCCFGSLAMHGTPGQYVLCWFAVLLSFVVCKSGNNQLSYLVVHIPIGGNRSI
jgi:hypothetical protein